MQEISELDLPYLAMEEPWFAADPGPQFSGAREQHSWIARSDLGYVVTNYQAVRDLMAMDECIGMAFGDIVEMMGAQGTFWGRFQQEHILSKSGPDHKRMRDLLAPAFTPRRANQHRELMQEVISELLDEWAPKAEFDFEEFASHFPIRVMCRLVGAPSEAISGLRESLETMGLSVSMLPELTPKLEEAILRIEDFSQEIISNREATWQSGDEGDLLDLLLQAKQDGGMSRREIADLLIFLLTAGYDTSKNVLTLAMFELVKQPDIYKRMAKDPELCARVFEETMRIHGPTNTSRIVVKDITYRDVSIPAGTMLWFAWSVIARDPAAVDDPDSFNPDRSRDNRHVGFALGPHICLGQHIAKAQIAEGLHQMAQRITNPQSPGPLGWRPFPGVWGIRGLPISFEPA
ncbi:MAG: cytochrome P450 [Novosphingobium sp.]|nr:cytochrome P450 [Novosphingobium sp.]